MTRPAYSAALEVRCAPSNNEFLVQTVKNLVGLQEQDAFLFSFFVVQMFISF
jgi:hypothetical protein